MRLLIYEFITGGGLIDAPLPPSLQREGAMMRDALLRDVADLPHLNIVLTRDSRCSWPSTAMSAHYIEPRHGESGLAFFERAIAEADLVWPIAPDAELIALARIVRATGKRIVLSDEETIALCTSKFTTTQSLQKFGVNTVATYRVATDICGRSGQWISKPDKGSGGEGVRLWPNSDEALQACLLESEHSRVFQPWCPGDSLSLSMLCFDGSAILLSVNRQQITWREAKPCLDAITVNVCDRKDFNNLAQQIARSIPGLRGYIGVDLIRSDDSVFHVLEINPRLTTSYCGLRDALGINIAALVLAGWNGELPNTMEYSFDRPIDLHLVETMLNE
jgi:tyramine---L-glutamate ligase